MPNLLKGKGATHNVFVLILILRFFLTLLLSFCLIYKKKKVEELLNEF